MSERENTKLCQALETILYWQKELHEKRMKFNNSTEGRERESKWKAFHDHMCTLIETNGLKVLKYYFTNFSNFP
jgi:hypothetical protein